MEKKKEFEWIFSSLLQSVTEDIFLSLQNILSWDSYITKKMISAMH